MQHNKTIAFERPLSDFRVDLRIINHLPGALFAILLKQVVKTSYK